MKQIIKMKHCGVYYIELSDGTIGFFARAEPGSRVLDIEEREPRYFKSYQEGRAFIRKFYNM